MNKKYLIKIPIGIILLVSMFAGSNLFGQVLFEGYSKITYQGNFVGFIVQRYSFDQKKKEFSSVYLVKYNEAFGNSVESLKAFASEGMEPLRYTYNVISGTKAQTIEGVVLKNQMTLNIKDYPQGIGKKPKLQKRQVTLPQGAFLSTFLGYVILRNPQGLKAGNTYEYKAVAEESGELLSGKASVLSEEVYKNLPVLKIQNDFPIVEGKAQDSFLSFATTKVEPVAVQSPLKNMAIELMMGPKEAMGNLTIEPENLKLLFGDIPEGRKNSLFESVGSVKIDGGPKATEKIKKNKGGEK